MKINRARRQRGVVLLAMLAVIMLAATWMLINQLNSGSAGIDAARKTQNAAVLQRAKLALIGYVAAQAVKAGENHPGVLPCPEAAGYFDSTTDDGKSAGTCSLPKVGRFPWRTIGTDKLIDASGEPLWYVVSPGWAYTSGTGPVINSDTTGQLTVDGIANDAVALIIAPGPAFNAAASSGCAAKNQTRPTSGTPDWSNYLECENATYPTADATFVTTGPSASFNDQVLKITVADIMPAIEAGIANRIEREIAPLIAGVYSANASWGNLATLLPMGVAFSVPTSNVNAYAGTAAMQGLLPLSYAWTATSGTDAEIPCTPATTAPNYCEPNFVRWSGTPALTLSSVVSQQTSSCSVSTVTYSASPLIEYTKVDCTARATNWAGITDTTFSLVANALNAGASLRQFRTTATMSGISSALSRTATATLNSSGTAAVTLQATATGTTVADATCGLSGFAAFFFNCYTYSLSVPVFLLGDHPNVHALLDSTDATTGWFVRNNWHQLSYYAVAPAVAPGGTGSCVASSTCLQVTYHPSDGKQRAVLVLAGRALTGQDRSSSTLSNWFEGANADGTSPFEARSATLLTNRTFNDRIAVLSTN